MGLLDKRVQFTSGAAHGQGLSHTVHLADETAHMFDDPRLRYDDPAVALNGLCADLVRVCEYGRRATGHMQPPKPAQPYTAPTFVAPPNEVR